MGDLEQLPKVTKVLHDIMHMFCFVGVVFNLEPQAFSFRTEDFVMFLNDLGQQHLRKKKNQTFYYVSFHPVTKPLELMKNDGTKFYL